MTIKFTALDVAQYFLYSAANEGEKITQLKIEKLTYYAQAWNLVFRYQPFFKDVIEAWAHGPVVKEVYQQYKSFKYHPIPKPRTPVPQFGHEDEQVLDYVWHKYKGLSPREIELLTHNELPWKLARSRAGVKTGDKSNEPLLLDEMESFYADQFYESKEESPIKTLATIVLKTGKEVEVDINNLFDYLEKNKDSIQQMDYSSEAAMGII